jgi:ribonuclease HI
MLWRWWLRRNKLNAKEQACTEENLKSQINYWTQECDMYCRKGENNTPPKEASKWVPPPGDILKINIDGSFMHDSGQGGWGFVIRDAAGWVRGAGAGKLNHLASAAQAEAMACLEAVQAAAGWGMGNVQIESDSQNLIKAVQCTESDLTHEGILYREIRAFVSSNFISSNFQFCPRTCNKVAHAMAALGASQDESHLFWQEMVPNFVNVLVASEYAEPV